MRTGKRRSAIVIISRALPGIRMFHVRSIESATPGSRCRAALTCRPRSFLSGYLWALPLHALQGSSAFEEPLVDQRLGKFAELTRSELWRDEMWTKLGMVAILA